MTQALYAQALYAHMNNKRKKNVGREKKIK
jgi:hypothetical protein